MQCGNGKAVVDAVVQILTTELNKGEDSSEDVSEEDLFVQHSPIDPQLISWLLLFLSLCLDSLRKENGLYQYY